MFLLLAVVFLICAPATGLCCLIYPHLFPLCLNCWAILLLQAEMDAGMQELARMKKEHAATKERLRQLKKEFEFID